MQHPPRDRDKRPSQYEIDAERLVELGRELGTTDAAKLAAAFYRRNGVAPNPGALDMSELILLGDEVL